MRKPALMATMLLCGCAGYAPPQSETQPPPATVAKPPPVADAPRPQVTQPTPRRPQPIRIDNTSLASFRASWERLHASLSPQQRADLNHAVAELTFAGYGDADNMPANLRSSPIVPEMIRHRIAGMTYAEIIALSP